MNGEAKAKTQKKEHKTCLPGDIREGFLLQRDS